MGKIFRLYKDGANTYQGWNESPSFPYNSTNRDSIEDPNGASARHEITSIPSPFARIDLIKNAFREVCKSSSSLDGNSIFHKMVSDTLDVGEIFFNIDKFKNKIQILTWDPKTMIQELEDSDYEGHQYYADALKKYLLSDASTYNFEDLQKIYLLNYLDGPDQLNIIGATSPATLFFCTSNSLDYVSDNLNFGQDRPFDSEYQPLYKRDFEYIKFWYILKSSIKGFANLFPEIDDYLIKTFRLITDKDKKAAINAITAADINTYSPIDVNVSQHVNSVEVLGYNLFKNVKPINTGASEMIIKSSISPAQVFVLPIESGNKYANLKYTSAKWGNTNAAPVIDPQSNLSLRTLPFDGAQHPYLTISDFLEDTLVEVPHKLNSVNFFNGNITNVNSSGKETYLVPLKPNFFTYFSVKDLQTPLPDGKYMLQMETLAGGLKVYLRIPITGNGAINYIEYSRKYYKNRAAKVDGVQNEGGVVNFDFSGFVMPCVKFNQPSDAFYKVSLISPYNSSYSFRFYEATTNLTGIMADMRKRDSSNTIKSETYSIVKNNFDYIQVEDKNGKRALIIPNFADQVSTNSFDFAIDLGTSNTHIEFKKHSDPTSSTFEYSDKNSLLAQFFLPSYLEFDGQMIQEDLIDETALIEKDYLPNQIGSGTDYFFPTRTVLSCSESIDWTNNVNAMGLTNLPLTYDKRRSMPYNEYHCNIKWGTGVELRMMESYVDNLLFMIRNMVIANKGDLHNTNITWFYPTSMAPKRLNIFRSTWDKVYNQYFTENGSTSSMTESSAPIQYYFNRYATATNLVNVDIGGGTTDIAFAKDKEVKFITSMRFAANVLFENSYSSADISNGIVDYFKNGIKNLLDEKNINEIKSIFDSENNRRSSNMSSFLFTLKDNSLLKDVDSKSIDFNYILQNDENFKISFILFYTAIIYHIAKIVKIKDLEIPRHVAFSGNGSKLVKIVSPDNKILSKYTRIIFEKVTGKKIEALDVLGLDKDSNPKEATCKGGLYTNTQDSEDRDKIVVLKGTGDTFVSASDTYDSVTESYKESVVNEVKKFLTFTLDDMNNAFNFDDNFGVSNNSLKIAKTECYKDLKTYLDKGLAQRKEESDGKNSLEETTFFYPIKGAINKLSDSIYRSLTNKD